MRHEAENFFKKLFFLSRSRANVKEIFPIASETKHLRVVPRNHHCQPPIEVVLCGVGKRRPHRQKRPSTQYPLSGFDKNGFCYTAPAKSDSLGAVKQEFRQHTIAFNSIQKLRNKFLSKCQERKVYAKD